MRPDLRLILLDGDLVVCCHVMAGLVRVQPYRETCQELICGHLHWTAANQRTHIDIQQFINEELASFCPFFQFINGTLSFTQAI